MAADLDGTLTAGLQLRCAPVELGAFASPERRLLFDLNDFDETLPARSSTTSSGWRRASRSRPATTASPTRHAGGDPGVGGGLRRPWPALPPWARWPSGMPTWTRTAPERGPKRRRRGQEGLKKTGKAAKQAGKTLRKGAAGKRTRDSLQALSKLGERVDGQDREPAADRGPGGAGGHLRPVPRPGRGVIREQFRAYRATLRDDQRRLLERFQVVDMARKVVGVRCRHPGLHRPAPGPRLSRTRCSCRSRRPPPRSWRATCERAVSSTVSG